MAVRAECRGHVELSGQSVEDMWSTLGHIYAGRPSTCTGRIEHWHCNPVVYDAITLYDHSYTGWLYKYMPCRFSCNFVIYSCILCCLVASSFVKCLVAFPLAKLFIAFQKFKMHNCMHVYTIIFDLVNLSIFYINIQISYINSLNSFHWVMSRLKSQFFLTRTPVTK